MTLGCKVNQVETEMMISLFLEKGYEIVDFTEIADVYVINTCSVTSVSEQKSRKIIRRAKKTNEKAAVIVVGCYAQVAPDEIAEIPDVSVIIGSKDKSRIVELAEAALNGEKINAVQGQIPREFEDMSLIYPPKRTRAFLKIEDGCENFCSYCIIPYARGPVRSRSLESVKREAVNLSEKGFLEIVLTGTHIGMYGKDLGGVTLFDAAKTVLENTNIERLRLSSLESVELSEDLINFAKDNSRFAKHFHLPLQSGSNSILKAMNRHYKAEDFEKLTTKIIENIPEASISTDIIVGFPGETDELFEETATFIKKLPLSRIHVFPYSKRPGTVAASMDNQVSETEKKRRVGVMQDIGKIKSREFMGKFMGKSAAVLFETETNGVTDGLTSNYIRVYTKDKVETGKIYDCIIEDFYRDGVMGRVAKKIVYKNDL
ncbi:MAG: tRNA (N(6)-L-threonylcarbamoyladenosine(37)-C(2))-methylthiotransferase MtaB [Selenomonadaceae bacterium]|nr:tRNA (N(6)-L-threonylcarbamoyladenosine(37)-C(2))-methylthiotransferase MtaB [Selenomonadaceae bacterium]